MDDVSSSIGIGRVKCFLKRLLVTNVVWNYDQQKCIQLDGDVEWMRCHVERGYGNLTPCENTLWVRVKSDMLFITTLWVRVKSDMLFFTVLHSSMRRSLVENILLVAERICAL